MKIYIKPLIDYYCSKNNILTYELTENSSQQIINECLFNLNPSVFRVIGDEEEIKWLEDLISDYWNTDGYENAPVIVIANNKTYVFHFDTFEEYRIKVQHLDRLLNQIRTANANIVAYQFKEKE